MPIPPIKRPILLASAARPVVHAPGQDPVMSLIAKHGGLKGLHTSDAAKAELRSLGKEILKIGDGYRLKNINDPLPGQAAKKDLRASEERFGVSVEEHWENEAQCEKADWNRLAAQCTGGLYTERAISAIENLFDLLERAGYTTDRADILVSPIIGFNEHLIPVIVNVVIAIEKTAGINLADAAVSAAIRRFGHRERFSELLTSLADALPAALRSARRIMPADEIVPFVIKVLEMAGEAAGPALEALTVAAAVRLTPDRILIVFGQIINSLKAQPDLLDDDVVGAADGFKVFKQLFARLPIRDQAAGDLAASRFVSMLSSLTDYNKVVVIRALMDIKSYRVIRRENFLPHYNLYMDILVNRKKLGFGLLEGVMEATRQRVIPEVITPAEAQKINRFIDRAHSFSPVLYSLYREKGEAVLDELVPFVADLRADLTGQAEIERLIENYRESDGLEIVFAAIQMVIPLSGASFVKRTDAKDQLQQIVAAGDLRSHIPEPLRGLTGSLTLGRSRYSLRAGQAIDLQAIDPILEGLRSTHQAAETELVTALTSYLQSDRGETAKEKVRQVLYSFASRRDLLGEKVERLVSGDHYTLRLLEEIFRDKDCLNSILVRAIEKLPPKLLTTEKTPLLQADGLVRAINKMWRGQGTTTEKARRLAAISARYRTEDLRQLAIAGGLLPAAAAALGEILTQENQAILPKQKVAEQLLAAPLTAIQQEKAKYELKTAAESLRVQLQVVKGIPFGMWGLCAGVCLARDVELWKDPKFKLIAMIDEESGTAVGFVHVYETEVNGKKVWTLPGINPSTEFIGTVDPRELYDKLMTQVIELAKIGGAAAVYIPTAEIIHSNRSDLQKAIKDQHYQQISIPPVSWSRMYDYAFSEVFVAWEAK